MNIFELFKIVIQRNATDLHLTSGSPPMIRLHGDLIPLADRKLNPEEIEKMVISILTDEQRILLGKKLSVDTGYSFNNGEESHRFRINIFYQKGVLSAAFRKLSDEILSLEQLNLPASLYKFCEVQDGLVLVTGPTGSGKTTTLASLLDRINEIRACHIITIEDPIEYIQKHKKSIVNQRELFTDVLSFADGLRYGLREDPDVILVGEMRDTETIRTTLMSAETGHLVFSTLHSRDTISTITRIIGVFPAEEQPYIRHQLSMTLKAVISQRLLKRIDIPGLIPAVEIMVVTPSISNLIRLGKYEQIYSVVETEKVMGMHTMDESLNSLYVSGKISEDIAFRMIKNQRLFKEKIAFTRGRKRHVR